MTESRLKSDFKQFSTSAFCSLPHGQEIVLANQLPHNTTLTSVVCKVETSLQSSSISIWKALAFQTWGYAHTLPTARDDVLHLQALACFPLAHHEVLHQPSQEQSGQSPPWSRLGTRVPPSPSCPGPVGRLSSPRRCRASSS